MRQRDEESRESAIFPCPVSHVCTEDRNGVIGSIQGLEATEGKMRWFGPVSNKLGEFCCEARMEEVERGQRGEGNEGG